MHTRQVRLPNLETTTPSSKVTSIHASLVASQRVAAWMHGVAAWIHGVAAWVHGVAGFALGDNVVIGCTSVALDAEIEGRRVAAEVARGAEANEHLCVEPACATSDELCAPVKTAHRSQRRQPRPCCEERDEETPWGEKNSCGARVVHTSVHCVYSICEDPRQLQPRMTASCGRDDVAAAVTQKKSQAPVGRSRWRRCGGVLRWRQYLQCSRTITRGR